MIALALALTALLATPSAEVDALMAREDQLLDGLEALDRQILGFASQQRAQADALAAAEQAATQASAAVDVLALKRHAQRQRVRARLTLHRRVDARAWLALVTRTDNNAAFLRQRHALRRVLRADVGEAVQLAETQAALKAQRDTRDAALAEVAQRAAALADQRARLERQRGIRAEVLRALQGARRGQLMVDQQAAQAGLTATLSTLGGGPAAGDLAAERGRLPRPVPGPVLQGYGLLEDPELGTRVFRKGVTLAAPRGAPVRAIYDGTVAYADWYRGFGHLVLLDHGAGWFSLYAHLDRIGPAAGDTIRQGTPVGEAGDTGRLGGPALYFELRRGEAAVDPAQWLRPASVGAAGASDAEVGPSAR